MKYILLFIFTLFSITLIINPAITYAQDIYTTDKLITVDLNKQTLYAWEGGKIIYQTPISSGLPQSPTIKGSFHIYRKLPLQRMRGISPVHGRYDLPDVPDVMYFTGGYAIHGAYWHNNFGQPMSNGCVNTPLAAASWLYEFAPAGTPVIIF